MIRRLRTATFLLVCATVAPAFAVDQIVPLPTGWEICPYWFAASAERTAVVLYPAGGDPFNSTSRVMIVGGPSLVYADLPGKVFYTTYSATGLHLLALHEGPFGRKVTLLSGTTGVPLWTKDDGRLFLFSLSGAVVYAQEVLEGHGVSGDSIEIFDLSGMSLRRFELSANYHGALVPGDGSTALFALGESVASFNAVPTMHREWSMQISTAGKRFHDLRPLGTGRFVAVQGRGSFKVISTAGAVEYAFDPQALAATDPSRTLAHYASYNAYPTPFPSMALLFNDTSDGLLLDLSAGTLASKLLNVAAPSGFTCMKMVDAGKLVFYSSTSLLIRPIVF